MAFVSINVQEERASYQTGTRFAPQQHLLDREKRMHHVIAWQTRQLVPEEDFVPNLRADFEAMVAAGMFYGEEPPAFDEILERLHHLERAINRVIRTS